MDILSPVTNTKNTSLITQLDVPEIILRYKNMGMDVRRFFEGTPTVYLYQCNDTLYRFYYPLTIFGDDDFYQDLYAGMPNYYYPGRWEYSYALSKIPNRSKVLEIGSGAGLFLEQLLAKDCEVTGLELNSKAIADSRKKGLDVHAEFIETFGPGKKDYYDIVCSFQVLEHVADVKSFIKSALVALKPGGLLIISVPNSNPYFLKYDKYHTLNLPPHHSGLWNKQSLKNITDFFQLKLTEIEIEPLKEHKEWYQIHLRHFKSEKPWLGFLMQLVPRPLYKGFLKLFSSSIEGAYITGIYTKR